MPDSSIPKSLRHWFLLHFVVDMLFAIPLLFLTSRFLAAMGFPGENLILARLVGAALLGIGGASLAAHRGSREVYQIMLTLKLLWSGAALVAIGISLYQGAPPVAWLFLTVFVLFLVVWAYYYFLLRGKDLKEP